MRNCVPKMLLLPKSPYSSFNDDMDRLVLWTLRILLCALRAPLVVLWQWYSSKLHAQKEKGWSWILCIPFNGNSPKKERQTNSHCFLPCNKRKYNYFLYSDVAIFNSYSNLQLRRVVWKYRCKVSARLMVRKTRIQPASLSKSEHSGKRQNIPLSINYYF